MKQTIADYQSITCLDSQDDNNLNFRHVALAFQQYSEDKALIAENNEERQHRLKLCSKIIGAVVEEVMSDYKVISAMVFQLHSDHHCYIVSSAFVVNYYDTAGQDGACSR